MLLEKRSFRARVFIVAENLGIEQNKVLRVVNKYFSICREDLLNGKVVKLLGFATLVPDVITDEYVNTTAMYCKMVSNIEGVTYFTVREIMREYFDSCKKDLFEGRTIDFRSLVTLHPTNDGEKICNVHASLSATINSELAERASGVTSARAHICKILKGQLQQVRLLEVSS